MSQAVLVTGGAGYIGAHACKALAGAGFRPVVFDNLSRGRREAVRWGPLIEADLADRPRLCAALVEHRVAAVMHFAAYAYPLLTRLAYARCPVNASLSFAAETGCSE
jgi:UDP-glucose 4-epimerase